MDGSQITGLDEWVRSGSKGASVNSMAAHLAGRGEQRGSYPHDGSDFSRCEGLLEMVPSLRPSLHKMAEVNAYWGALVPMWDQIKATSDKTALIKKIIAPVMEQDPNSAPFGENASIEFGHKNTFGSKLGINDDGDDEALFRQAVTLVWQERKASTSFIQRKLAIGYNNAAKIIERMEEMAIVSKPDHVGKREIRDPDDLRAALNIRKEVMDIAGEEKGRIMLDAIVMGMKAADSARRKAQGKPPMKPDPSFDTAADNSYRVTADELRQFIERIERLDSEKKDIADQTKEVFAEAKARGYDTKVLRKVVALRKRKPDDVAEEQAVLDLYTSALGMA